MRLPLLKVVEWTRRNNVLAFFSSGKVAEIPLPWVKSAKHARIIDGGMGLDPGNGKEVGADTLAQMPCRVLLPGRAGWVGAPRKRRA